MNRSSNIDEQALKAFTFTQFSNSEERGRGRGRGKERGVRGNRDGSRQFLRLIMINIKVEAEDEFNTLTNPR
jgi:hypothetical protein